MALPKEQSELLICKANCFIVVYTFFVSPEEDYFAAGTTEIEETVNEQLLESKTHKVTRSKSRLRLYHCLVGPQKGKMALYLQHQPAINIVKRKSRLR